MPPAAPFCSPLTVWDVQMLDADGANLEQAMQIGAALKRAGDLQKAAKKPKATPHLLTLPAYHWLMVSDVQSMTCLYDVTTRVLSCKIVLPLHASLLGNLWYLSIALCYAFHRLISA